VDGAPKNVKENVSKEEAETIKKKFTDARGDGRNQVAGSAGFMPADRYPRRENATGTWKKPGGSRTSPQSFLPGMLNLGVDFCYQIDTVVLLKPVFSIFF